jgi:hypothetical protein
MKTLLRLTQQALIDCAEELPRGHALLVKHAEVLNDAGVATCGYLCLCGHWMQEHAELDGDNYDGPCMKRGCGCKGFREDKGEEPVRPGVRSTCVNCRHKREVLALTLRDATVVSQSIPCMVCGGMVFEEVEP